MVTVVPATTERRQPDARADHRAAADDRLAAEDRGVGVDHHAVLDRRMAFLAADEIALRVGGETQRAEGDALVELHPLADLRGLADHHAGAVVDEEVAADLAPGWMSMPVRLWAHSVIIRGISGTPSPCRIWARR